MSNECPLIVSWTLNSDQDVTWMFWHHLILFGTIQYYLDIDRIEQARDELGQAQIILGLGKTNMINNKYLARSLSLILHIL